MARSMVKESFGKITGSELDAKAAELGVELPAPYRAFLLKSNGGKLEREMFSFVEDGNQTESNVRALFCWGPHPYYSLFKKLALFGKPGFPKDVLPIGEDAGGNLICLVVAGRRKGQVWFWDQDGFGAGDEWANMHLVAPDFDAFLDALQK